MWCVTVVHIFSAVLIVADSTLAQEENPFNYDDPSSWGAEYPQCNQYRQSPINLNTDEAIKTPLWPLVFEDYDAPLSAPLQLTNIGRTVELQIPVTVYGNRPTIFGGVLTHKYEAESLHFHWSSPGIKGSEHHINNCAYDVELHIVHKSTQYPTMDEAMRHHDGLAVLAIMFEGVPDNVYHYTGFDYIFSQLSLVVNFNATTVVRRPVTLSEVLADLDVSHFYTYKGSVTSPPCAESVIWHVFPAPLPIAYSQIQKFFNILDNRNKPLINNFRPVQPDYNRPILLRT